MKQYSITLSIIVAIVCHCSILQAAPFAAPQDTTDRYVINNQRIDNFNGMELVGKKIVSYRIVTYKPGPEGVLRVHDIHTEDEAQSAKAKEERVNIGYGEADKRDVSYAIGSVKTNDNEHYTKMTDYLRGRVAGVQVGPDEAIYIRGINSIKSSTQPLILLDGVEITDINIVRPGDVYSVDVLKDASAAIYGIKGANGVILITTKSGRNTGE